MQGVDYVLHQAALGSVPRSIDFPLASHEANVDSFITLFEVARKANVKKVVYASSSSVYGTDKQFPKIESSIGEQECPYAATRRMNEIYASTCATTYEMPSAGWRYFNVFGARQDPKGAYAAVIPLWIDSILNNVQTFINGDGSTSRDFCYIKNVVSANILS